MSALGPSAERTIDFQPGDSIGEYRIDRKLGEGGMGSVYAGVHTVIGKRAAIKLLRKELCANPEAIARFIQEARAANQIGHPNIVDVFGFGTAPDGRAFLAMEWLKGESLGQRADRGRLPLDEICAVVDDISRALEAAHEAGIIHRDLKPDNVFLAEVRGGPPVVKLLDFGIAKLTRTDEGPLSHTQTGAIVGTPMYIAPEQARGYAIDGAADIYSLGVMMFELIAGRFPFIADNAMDLIAKHLSEEPPTLTSVAPEAPDELAALVARMLAKQASERPSLAEVREVVVPLRRAASDGPVRFATPPSGVPVVSTPSLTPAPVVAPSLILPSPRSRGPWIALGCGVAVIAVVAFVIVSKAKSTNGSEPATTPPPTTTVTTPATAAAAPHPTPLSPPRRHLPRRHRHQRRHLPRLRRAPPRSS
ncbi:MAG: serine/threonine protein kinase [Myxococcales bacterium]|nr:serine/threonine protein kinase [Myxococcales bacterium]